MKEETKLVVLPKLVGGPKGLGDPNDRSLRRVEKDVLIPKIIRERTKTEKCVDEVKEFHNCVIETGILHVVKCRKENDTMKLCMEKWFYDQDFIKECTEQYLKERSEYRRTGIPKKQRSLKMNAPL